MLPYSRLPKQDHGVWGKITFVDSPLLHRVPVEHVLGCTICLRYCLGVNAIQNLQDVLSRRAALAREAAYISANCSVAHPNIDEFEDRSRRSLHDKGQSLRLRNKAP